MNDRLAHYGHPNWQGFDAQLTVMLRNGVMTPDEAEGHVAAFIAAYPEVGTAVEAVRDAYDRLVTQRSPLFPVVYPGEATDEAGTAAGSR